jgi:rhodanese-related sulfurtransferase
MLVYGLIQTTIRLFSSYSDSAWIARQFTRHSRRGDAEPRHEHRIKIVSNLSTNQRRRPGYTRRKGNAMKTQMMILILLTAVLGCTREPQNTTSISSSVPTQANREVNPDDRELVVICQVIGTQSEHLSQILKQAGIDCTIQGDEFHDVLVPKHKQQEAVDVVANEARQSGYEITWSVQ